MDEKLIKGLFEVGAISIDTSQPFIYDSRKIGPVYFDVSRVINNPMVWNYVVEKLVYLIKDVEEELDKIDVVSGGVTRDVVFSTPVAYKLGKRAVIFRKDVMVKHGKEPYIGEINKGDRFIHVADALHRGKSSSKWIDAIRNYGGVIENYYVVIDRRMGGKQVLENKGIKVNSLIDFDSELLGELKDLDYINDIDVEEILKFYENPKKWAENFLKSNIEFIVDNIQTDEKGNVILRIEDGHLVEPKGLSIILEGYPCLREILWEPVVKQAKEKGISGWSEPLQVYDGNEELVELVFWGGDKMFSDEAKRCQTNYIRRLLRYAHSDVISLAGGLPNPDVFPLPEEYNAIVNKLNLKKAFQYSSTGGINELKEELVNWMKTFNVDTNADNILITTGSQQGLYLISRILLNDGDPVFLEEPTYIGMINPLKLKDASVTSFELEDDGMNIDLLEEELERVKKLGVPKFIYVVPTFQNPSGITMSENKRKKLVDLANEYDFYIVEDDPYSKLRYEGDEVKPIKAFDDNNRVIYLGTFSKIFVPGFRLGWVVAHEGIIDKLALYKQNIDLHSTTYGQFVAAECLKNGIIQKVVSNAINVYGKKRDIMLKALEDYMENAKWTKPQGGMFIWLKLEGMDTEKLLEKAIQKGVAYVPGKAFSYYGGCESSMRLNFSYVSDEDIVNGVKKLAEVIKWEKQLLLLALHQKQIIKQ